jgi:hypothetical protein
VAISYDMAARLNLRRSFAQDFKFLPQPGKRKKLEQVHDFKQSALDHHAPEETRPISKFSQSHAPISSDSSSFEVP